MSNTERFSCEKCGRPLEGAFSRPLRKALTEEVHAHGDVYVVRESMGYEVVGECLLHGLRRLVPMGPPMERKTTNFSTSLRLVV